MYRQIRPLPVLFVGRSRHFVEGHIVVSTRSPGRTSGDFMTSRSLLLSSAALLLPISPALAQQPPQPAPPAEQAPVSQAPAAAAPAQEQRAPAAAAAASASQPVDDLGGDE